MVYKEAKPFFHLFSSVLLTVDYYAQMLIHGHSCSDGVDCHDERHTHHPKQRRNEETDPQIFLKTGCRSMINTAPGFKQIFLRCVVLLKSERREAIINVRGDPLMCVCVCVSDLCSFTHAGSLSVSSSTHSPAAETPAEEDARAARWAGHHASWVAPPLLWLHHTALWVSDTWHMSWRSALQSHTQHLLTFT